MPKPVKRTTKKSTTGKRPSSDPNLRVHQMMAEHAVKVANADPPKPKVPAAVADYMSRIGKKGGTVSGAKRMEMPVEQRKAIALKAARARWQLARKKGE
jgi:hypothetical protein